LERYEINEQGYLEMANFGISNIIAQLKSNKLIIPNKFEAIINSAGIQSKDYKSTTKSDDALFTKNKSSLQFLVKSFSTPGYSVTWHENSFTGTGLFLGTAQTGKIEDIKIEFYNTGKEYMTIINEIKNVMNLDTNVVGYHLDLERNITINCFSENSNNLVYSIQFEGCILSNVGGLSFSHDAKDWQFFDTQWTVRTFNFLDSSGTSQTSVGSGETSSTTSSSTVTLV
jgi:hypothetical protein